MAFTSHSKHTTQTTATHRRRGIFPRRNKATTTTTTTHVAPVHHHKRKPSITDKIAGALMKLKGSLTHRSGVKAAGTRRMRGTDGRGARY